MLKEFFKCASKAFAQGLIFTYLAFGIVFGAVIGYCIAKMVMFGIFF